MKKLLRRALGFFYRDDDVPLSFPPTLRINEGNPYAAEAARQIAEMGEGWLGGKRATRVKPSPSALEAALATVKADRSPAAIFLERCDRYVASTSALDRARHAREIAARTSGGTGLRVSAKSGRYTVVPSASRYEPQDD